jgi:hypothetical protein
MAENCNTDPIGSYVKPCERYSSGIRRAWVSTFSASTVWSAATSGTIVYATNAPTFRNVEIRQGNSQVNELIVANEQAGTINLQPGITLVLHGTYQEQRNWANQALNSRLWVVAQTEDNKHLLLGVDAPLSVVEGEYASGVQAGESVGITLTFRAGGADGFAPLIDNTYFSTIAAA